MDKKWLLFYIICLVLGLMIGISALPVTYNPFSGKLDYYGLLNHSCSVGDFVNGILVNGTFICDTPPVGTIIGTGIFGYIPMWNGTTSLNNSAIYQNGSNVGIGTTTPQSVLNVNGTPGSLAGGLSFGDGDSGLFESVDDQMILALGGSTKALFSILGISSGSGTGHAMLDNTIATGTIPGHTFWNDFDTGIGRAGVDVLSLIAGGVNIMNLNGTSGNVGIGTTTPTELLVIEEDQNAATRFVVSNSHTGTAVSSQFMLANYDTPYTDNSLRHLALGRSFTTTGGFIQDGGLIVAEKNLAGGLTLMARHTSGKIRFYTNGINNERMVIDENGKVGIGTNSPSSLLDLEGTDADIEIGNGTYSNIIKTSDAEGLNGNDFRVGLDESNRMFYIVDKGDIDTDFGDGKKANPTIVLRSADGTGWVQMDFDSFISSGSMIYQSPGTFLFRSSATNLAAGDSMRFETIAGRGMADTNGEQTWVFVEPRIKQSGTAAYNGLKIDVLETTIGDGSTGDGNNLFNAAIESVSKFVIDRAGSVGIGTTSPNTILEVNTTDVGEGAIIGSSFIGNWNTSTAYAVFAHKNFQKEGTKYAFIQSDAGATFFNSAAGQPLRFLIGANTKMILDSSGGLGIGTTTPQRKLHVTSDILSNATINATGDVCIEGGNCLSGVYTKTESDAINTSNNNFILYTNGTAADYTDSKLITTFFNASTNQTVIGTPSGTIDLLQAYDRISYNVSESSSDLDFRVNFTSITEFNQLIVRYKSSSTESHTMVIQIYDYGDSDWEDYRTVGNTENAYNIFTMSVYDDDEHVSGGVVQVRFYTNNPGGQTHLHQFDWISISKGPATPSSDETDPFAIHKDGNVALEANWGQGSFNLTNVDSWFLGKVDWSIIQNNQWDSNSSTVARADNCPPGEFVQNTTTGGVECAAAAGGGTVTSVATDDTYLTGGPIVSTGTITFNQTLAGTDLAVNSSDNWDNLDSFNATQMSNSGGLLNILESWLKSLFYTKAESDATNTSNNNYIAENNVSVNNYIVDYSDANNDSMKNYVDDTFLQNVVEDATPQLGGYLDTNGNDIGSTSDEIENIYIATNSRIYFGNDQEFSQYTNGTHLITG